MARATVATPHGRPVTVPTVHLNGTHGENLATDLETAGGALRAAIDALADTAPNARDYYPQGGDAFEMASQEHGHRMAALRNMYREIVAIHEAVVDQIDERDRMRGAK